MMVFGAGRRRPVIAEDNPVVDYMTAPHGPRKRAGSDPFTAILAKGKSACRSRDRSAGNSGGQRTAASAALRIRPSVS